jgi:hypothetical protein
MNLQKSFSKFLVNPLALKVVSAIAIINFLGYLILGNTTAVIYFILIGLIVSYFSKNMVLILGVPLLLVNLFAAGKRTAEGFEKMKKEAATTMDKKTEGDDSTKEEVKKEEKKDEPFEVGRKKNKGSYNIDYASTVEDAYDELNKIIGSDGIKRLTQDTQGLMKQQLQLTEAMSEMQPMIDQMGPLMDRVQTMMGGLNMLKKDDEKIAEGVTNIRDRKIGGNPTEVGSYGAK